MLTRTHAHANRDSESFTEPTTRHSRKDGLGLLLVSFFLALPSLCAFCSSWVILHGTKFPLSSVWFLYEISRNVGYVAVAVGTSLTVIVAIRHTVSETFVFLMGISVAGATFLLWYAGHIFRSPW